MFLIEYLPTWECLNRAWISSIEQINDPFCGFTTLLCFYLMLLYVADYAVLLLIFSLGLLFQFSEKSLTDSSVENVLVVSSIYKHMEVDLFNIFISSWKFVVFSTHLSHIWSRFLLNTGMEKAMYSTLYELPPCQIYRNNAGKDIGGNDKCFIKGCPEIASNKKITGLTGVYELKLSPDFLKQTNFQDINICNHHYYLNRKRGHKPNPPHSKAKHASQTASQTDFQSHKRDDWLARLDVKKSSSCAKRVVIKTSPCPQHILTVASNLTCLHAIVLMRKVMAKKQIGTSMKPIVTCMTAFQVMKISFQHTLIRSKTTFALNVVQLIYNCSSQAEVALKMKILKTMFSGMSSISTHTFPFSEFLKGLIIPPPMRTYWF